MNIEKEPIQVDFSSETEINRQDIADEILEFALNSGIEISGDEINISMNGAQKGNELEASTLFKVAERSAQLWYKADNGINESEKRNYGVQSLVLRAVSYLNAAPWASKKCLDLARKVYDRKIEWGEFEVPDADKDMLDMQIEEEQKKRKVA